MGFHIHKEKCVGCGACHFACLFKCIRPEDDAKTAYYIEEDHCLECGQCAKLCPNDAIAPPDHWNHIKKVVINPEKCNGCSACHVLCPAKAPQGERGSAFQIDQNRCFHCGLCAQRCRQKAIEVEYCEA